MTDNEEDLLMRVLKNPSAEAIEEFCANVLKSLLEAHAKGLKVSLRSGTYTRDVYASDSYGAQPIDAMVMGWKFEAIVR